jgi:hypothetical protein
MLTITEIQEQIELLQRKKEEILSYTIKDAVNEKFKSSFRVKISPRISRYKQDIKRLKFCAYIDAVFEILLKRVIDEQSTDIIMKYLRLCGKKNEFHSILSAYSKFRDNLEMRQLIKFCSAAYRYKLALDPSIRDDNKVNAYKSEMKYASSCEECGSLAFDLSVQMKKINFI